MNAPHCRTSPVSQYFGICFVFIFATATILLLNVVQNFGSLANKKPTSHICAQSGSAQLGSVALDVYIPPGRKDDRFLAVKLNLDEQVLPLAIDTSFADTFVATDRCDVTNEDSGCYKLDAFYKINAETNLLFGETFNTVLIAEQVLGNLSSVSLDLGTFEAQNTTVALVDWASPGEFRNGSFSGVLGLGFRTVSLTWRQHHRLPIMDTMISSNTIEKPLLSLRLPRYGDPDRKTGNLMFGDVEDIPGASYVAYRDIVPFSRSAEYPERLKMQGWSATLKAIRINDIEIPISPGRFRPDAQHVAVLDSGSPSIYLPAQGFDKIIPRFHRVTTTEPSDAGTKVFYECTKPQLLELKMLGRWFPVDPLDMLVPQSKSIINGTAMCEASIRSNTDDFGDSNLGMPFLRSVSAVFDYVDDDMYSISPRLGLASTVNNRRAMSRYETLYLNRLR